MKLRIVLNTLLAFSLFSESLQADDTNKLSVIASQILDPTKPPPEREALLVAHSDKSAKLIVELVNQIKIGTADEYRRIPSIWKVAINAGKRNKDSELKKILSVSLPQLAEPLRDWQAVVIGGGIINGLSLEGIWPRERIEKVLKGDADLERRWNRSIQLASIMADDEKVRHGTRYNALRMLGVAPWKSYGAQLTKYLGKDVNGELQQGAVSGLADVESNEAAIELIENFQNLTERNQQFALDGLLRNDFRRNRLLDAFAEEKIKFSSLGPARLKKLKESSPETRERVEQLEKKAKPQ